MRVCIVTTSFPRWKDDYRAPFIFEFAKELVKQGHFVRVVAMHTPGAKTFETMSGIEVHRARYLPEKFEVLQKEDGGMPETWRKFPAARLAILPFWLVQIFAVLFYSRDCDVIHANWSLSGISTWVGKFIHRKPYLVTVHGSDIFVAASIPFVSSLTRIALDASNGVITVSKSLAEALIKLKVCPQRITVIPNGVNTEVFFPSQDNRQKEILFVGNITENKGIRFLLEAFSNVTEVAKDFKLVLIGNGPQKAEFEALSGDLQIKEKVHFMGSRSQLEVGNQMRRSWLFVLPSLSEGFGVVLLEAMASGLPCIGTAAGGIPEIINDKVGEVVPPADPEALCKAILRLTQDSPEYHQMRDEAVSLVINNYTWSSVAKKIIRLYEGAIS